MKTEEILKLFKSTTIELTKKAFGGTKKKKEKPDGITV